MFRQSQLCLLVLLCALASPLTCAAQHLQSPDGNWWRSSGKERHSGFLAGYVDCSTGAGNKSYSHVEWTHHENLITQFYDAHPKELQKPVAEVFADTLHEHAQAPQHGAAPQTYKGKHGIFDGEYWRELPDQRESFLQGYLVCYQALTHRTATFSRPAAWYASEISKWYGVKEDDPAEINEKRVAVAISDVLFRFKDGPPGGSPQKKAGKE